VGIVPVLVISNQSRVGPSCRNTRNLRERTASISHRLQQNTYTSTAANEANDLTVNHEGPILGLFDGGSMIA